MFVLTNNRLNVIPYIDDNFASIKATDILKAFILLMSKVCCAEFGFKLGKLFWHLPIVEVSDLNASSNSSFV